MPCGIEALQHGVCLDEDVKDLIEGDCNTSES
jgi:hypothetical protein